MRPPTVVPFPATLGRLRVAKASLRPDVRASVERSIRELPHLAVRKPDAALLAGKLIHRWNRTPPDGGVEQTARRTPRPVRRRSAPTCLETMTWDCTSLALALGADPATFDLAAHTRRKPESPPRPAVQEPTRKTA